MYRFIETICLKDGNYPLLAWHQRRVDATFQRFFPGKRPHLLQEVLPVIHQNGRMKVRLVYDGEGLDVEYSEYFVKPIRSLRLVQGDHISYDFKFENREKLDQCYDRREMADDILITRHGKISDSWYANVCLWDGQRWVTPDAPLLPGVRRAQLIDAQLVVPQVVTVSDLSRYQKVSLVNAMLELGEVEVMLEQIW